MKKIPLRKCTGCGEMKPKRELIRVVRAPDKKDENGNVVCKSMTCFEQARKARRFERSLSCRIPEEVYEQMSAELGAAEGI